MKGLPKACGVFQRRMLPLLAALLAPAAARLGLAGTGDIATEVRCEALSDEVRAEFQARAQVDLSLRSGGGALEVVCQGLEARVTWRPRSGGILERAVPNASSAKALVDALLVAVAEVAADAMRTTSSDQRAADSGAPESTPTNKLDGTADGPRSSKEESKEPEARSLAGSSERAATPGAGAGWPLALGMSLGGQVAFFDEKGTGLAGPELGVLVGLPSGFWGSVAGSYALGLRDSSDVSTRAFGVTALLSKQFGAKRGFEIGAGGSSGAIIATPSAPFSPSSDSNAFLAGVARGRYAWTLDSWRFGVGPEFHFYAWRTEVTLDNRTVWHESLFSAGLTLDVSARVYGPLW